VHAAFFVAISACQWHPLAAPIFRRVAPVPLPVHASCTLLRRLTMSSRVFQECLRAGQPACSDDLHDAYRPAPAVGLLYLAGPSIEKNVADVLLTHVFNQQPDERLQPCELPNGREQEAWDLLKSRDQVEVHRDAQSLDERLEI
jgi:hypothetical protein